LEVKSMTVNLFDASYYRANSGASPKVSDAQLLDRFLNGGVNQGQAFSPFVDLSFYRASNSDLAAFSNRQLYDHLQNFGIAEGRRFSPLVDLNFYRNANNDLSRFSNEQLFEHLRTFGLNEGRTFSLYVDLTFYRNANSDLSSMSGAQAFRHLASTGVNEGRAFSPYVNLTFYRNANSDLSGFSNSQALSHLEILGINEGRVFSPYVDLNFYRNANSDLSAFNGQQLLTHLETFGVGEGRSFSTVVDLKFYRTFNGDLGGFSNKQLLQHLEIFGVNEGRRFDPFVDLGFYRSGNADLSSFGNSQLLQHLALYGLNENRGFTPFADLNFYRYANADLSALSGSGALAHLEIFGLNEQRVFSPYVDLELYRFANSDLQGFSQQNLLTHLQYFGVGEGRQFSYPFDVDYYALENPDLVTNYARGRGLRTEAVANSATEFAGLRNSVFKHFVQFGASEGRQASDEFDVEAYEDANADLGGLTNVQLYQHFRRFGLNEVRVLSDAYDTEYYQTDNTAPAGSSPAQLFRYYITQGLAAGDLAAVNEDREDERTDGLNLSRFALTGGTTTFNFNLSAEDEPNPDRLGSYAETYAISGLNPGQTVTVTMTGGFDTYLQLVNPITQEVVAENDNISGSDRNSQLTFTVPGGIDYLLRATSIDALNVGNYALVVTAAPTVVGTLAPNTSTSGTLSTADFTNPDREDTFRQDRLLDLTGIVAEQAVVLTLNSTAFDTYLQLVNADTKEVLAENNNAGPNQSQLTFTRQAGINYGVRVTSSKANGVGAYTLAMSTSGSGTSSLAVGQALNGSISSGNATDTYNLDLTGLAAGTPVRVNLRSTKFNSAVTITGSNGSTFTNDDVAAGNSDSEVVFTPVAGVTYQVQAQRSAAAPAGEGSYEVNVSAAPAGGSGVTLTNAGLNVLLGSKTTLTRADMLAFFAQAQADGTIAADEKADLETLRDKATQFKLSDGLRFLTDRVVSGLSDNLAAATFEQTLVGPNFFGTAPPKAEYVGEGDSARGNPPPKTTYQLTYQPIQGSLYGTNPSDGRNPFGPRIRDINQVFYGACVFYSVLGSLFPAPQFEGSANLGGSFLQGMITENGTETYNGKTYETWTFRFFQNGKAFFNTVDRQVGTAATAFGSSEPGQLVGSSRAGANGLDLADNGEGIWSILAERAYSQFREQISPASNTDSGYTLIGNGALGNDVLNYIVGGYEVNYASYNQGATAQDQPIGALTFGAIEAALNAGKPVVFGTGGFTDAMKAQTRYQYFAGSHEYTVTRAFTDGNGVQQVVVRNPWGKDGGTLDSGNPDDGFIQISYADFTNGVADDLAIGRLVG
jgi:hypothetical protein